MVHTRLAFTDINELAAGFACRELSPVEVTQVLLTRIDAYEPGLGSYVTMMADSALVEAQAAEAAFARGAVRGPLLGAPLAVKDLCDARGVPTYAGSSSRNPAQRTPADDAPLCSALEPGPWSPSRR